MQIIQTIGELRTTLDRQRHVALVPTMGNLHAGHLSLVRIARARGERVVTSIFVNRLQFAPHEDFATYPRTFARDCEQLAANGCDIVFAPPEAEMYPEEQQYRIQPPAELADVLEGAVRPGFFVGVCTVVLKLFNIVRPELAVFGKKDYQQLLVLRNMVRQLALPIELIAAEIVRNPGGLALSSRNGYLTEAQLAQASQLHETLDSLAAAAHAGRSDWRALEKDAIDSLSSGGWRPDYVAVRRRRDLCDPLAHTASADGGLVVLAAARLGGTRLIDNVEL